MPKNSIDDIRWKLEAALEQGLTPFANAVEIFMRGVTSAIEQITTPILHGWNPRPSRG